MFKGPTRFEIMGSKSRSSSKRIKKSNVPRSKLKGMKETMTAMNIKITNGSLALTTAMWSVFNEKRPTGHFDVAAAIGDSQMQALQTMVRMKISTPADCIIQTPEVDSEMKVVKNSDDSRSCWHLSDYFVKNSDLLCIIRKTACVVRGTTLKTVHATVLGSSGEQKVTQRQAYHADNKPFFIDVRRKKKPVAHMKAGEVPYYGLLSLDESTYILLYNTSSRTETTMQILPGHLFVWRGDVFHAGAACPSPRVMLNFNSSNALYVPDHDDECVYLDYCLNKDSTNLDYTNMPKLYAQAMANSNL